ncbi:hypothetical protein MmiAt1_00640 [Methanimicrococcus sp. At1]|uniref:DUF357 domain-containing protein n=1 Tax=Methanimicrococcus hacksteinii TaxID=3028293 RepID=A0ABU3VMA9_9EURY|nr:DUF357 domain-containing protein [Methanimicrococcus sp. At1]MDV0444538.1 hypothetical protein [Methanimicrococcus sp. At1]
MPADLYEKTIRYEKLLAAALEKAVPSSIEASHMRAVADDYRRMADAYHKDGLHFLESEDYVNALASFSYGHAWLDAGAKLGVFDVDDDILFTI